jgi:hypothetical protein
LIGLTTYSSNVLTLTTNNASQFATGELSVGSLDGITPSPQVTSISLPTGVNLTGIAGTLGLFTAAGGTIASAAGITAATLVGNAGTVSITGANEITDIGNFTARSFTFAQRGAVDVTGTVNGGTLASITSLDGLTVDGAVTATATSLSGGSLTINGSATGTASLNLVATDGDITAYTGTLTTTLLTGSATGDAQLEGTNTVATLGNFAVGDLFDLSGNSNLAVSGTVSGNNVQIEAPAITLTGTVSATFNAALVTDTGSINAAAGSVSAENLYVSSAGSAVFTGSNTVGTVTFDSIGSFVLNDTTQLVVDDSETDAGTSGAPPLVSLRAPTLIVGFFDDSRAPVRPGISALFASQAGLSAPGGTISLSADTLTLDAGVSTGTIGLVGLATYAGSLLTLTSGNAAEITTGELSVGSLDGITPSPLVTSIQLPNALNLTGIAGTLGLFTAAGGTVTSTQGLTAGTLVGNAGTVTLTGANSITTLGDFIAQSLTYAQAGDIVVGGKIDGGNLVSLSTQGSLTVAGAVGAQATSLSAGDAISITGTVTGSTTLDLDSGLTATNALNGGITATGSVNAGVLSGSGDSIRLTGNNRIASLGQFGATGGVTLTVLDSESLAITGPVTGGYTTISAPAISISGSVLGSDALALNALAGSITGAGALTAGPLTLTAAGGNISETGAITAASLTGSATGSVALSGANAIGNLGNFTAAGFSLSDTESLMVTGAVTGGSSVSLASAGALSLAAGGSLSGDSVALAATGGDISGTGAISTDQLAFSTPGTVSLTGANAIGAIGTGSAAAVTLADTMPLTVSGSVTAPTAALTAPAITVSGAMDDTTSLTLVAADGGIGGAGVVTTALLQGSATGSVGLTGANQIAGLGNFTAAGFSLQDATDLAVSGALAGGASASISDSASLAVTGSIDAASVSLSGASISLAGSVAAPTALSLTATQGGQAATVTGTGSVSTATLSGSAGGLFSLTGNNSITSLGNIASSGFTLLDSTPLAVSGTLQGGPSVVIDGAAALTVAGTIAATDTTLQASSITIPGNIATTAENGEILMDAPGSITLSGSLTAPTIEIGSLPNTASSAAIPAIAAANEIPTEVILAGGTIDTGTASGLSIIADTVSQTGLTQVNPEGGAAAISITLGGTQGAVTFDPAATQGLAAPTSSLLLALGAGDTSGNVRVASLSLTYSPPASTVISNLTGSIGGVTGPNAASLGTVQPAISVQYRFNGCELGGTACTVAVVQQPGDIANEVPIFVNPASGGPNNAELSATDVGLGLEVFGDTPRFEELNLSNLIAPFGREDESRRRRRHDDDLIMPNISAEDF